MDKPGDEQMDKPGDEQRDKPLLHYEKVRPIEDSPPPSGREPLVLTHGLFGSGNNLMTLARLFERERPVYLVDLPNHGKSPWIEDASYQTAAAYLHRTLEQIATESHAGIHLFGHSMGGKVAMALALLNDELAGSQPAAYTLRSIVVGDIAPRTYHPGHDVYFQAMQEMPAVRSRNEANEYMLKFVDNPQIRSFLLKNLSRGEDGCLHWRLNLRALIRDYPFILGWNLSAKLRSQLPALFLRGTRSQYIILVRDRRCIWGHFPRARLESIKRSGHWIHAEDPDRVHALVNTFLNNQGAT